MCSFMIITNFISIRKKYRSFNLYPRGGADFGGTVTADRHAIRLALLNVDVQIGCKKRFVVGPANRHKEDLNEVVVLRK